MTRFASLALPIALALPGPALAGMTQTYQASGNLGLEVTGLGGQGMPMLTGTFNLSALPPTAMVQKATVYASQINSTAPVDLVFNGSAPIVQGPIASDAAFNTLYMIAWDVTIMVNAAQTSYGFTIGQNNMGSAIAGVALAVVWQDPTEPMRTITIIDGMQQVGESGAETETVTFTGLPAGPTTAWVFTVYDDNTSTGETVSYNSNTIGGPIDQNVGLNATVLQMSTTSQMGSNTLAITTGSDHMGWVLGATAVTVQPVGIEPESWGGAKARYH